MILPNKSEGPTILDSRSAVTQKQNSQKIATSTIVGRVPTALTLSASSYSDKETTFQVFIIIMGLELIFARIYVYKYFMNEYTSSPSPDIPSAQFDASRKGKNGMTPCHDKNMKAYIPQ